MCLCHKLKIPVTDCLCPAEELLSFAFDHCHRSSQKNKRMILIYLLPVKMLLVRTHRIRTGCGWVLL